MQIQDPLDVLPVSKLKGGSLPSFLFKILAVSRI